jgi:hypothetical protein
VIAWTRLDRPSAGFSNACGCFFCKQADVVGTLDLPYPALVRRTLASALLSLSLLGCSSGLSVTRINSAEAKPNNVWVFFTVENDEEPVAGLTAEDFAIYEDEALVSPFESKQVIQNPEVAAVMYTHLLLDMSGSITESGEADAVVDAAHKFSERVGKTQ